MAVSAIGVRLTLGCQGGSRATAPPHNVERMTGFIIALIVIWIVLSIVGFVVEGLFWLAVIGIVLFLATSAWGWFSRKSRSAS